MVFVLSGKEVSGQSHHLGLSGGVNYSTLNSLKNTGFVDLWQVGPSLGITYESRFTKYFFLETGLMYNKRGAGQTVGMLNGESPSTDERLFMELNHHYISVPVSIGMRTGNRVAPFAQFGTVFSRILKSYNYFHPFQAWNNTGYSRNSIGSHAPFDFTMMLRVGVIAEISSRIEVLASATFEHAIFGLDIAAGNQHMGFLGHIGLKYRIGKSLE